MEKAQLYVGFALSSLTKEAQAVTSRNDSLAILEIPLRKPALLVCTCAKGTTNVIRDKIKSDGDISATEIMKWLMTTYNVDVPYMRAYREACFKGFIAGCRPYISLDTCHLKGKFNGVLAAVVSIDGNNSLFPVAYGVLESENTNSWEWFLESLKKAIGTPNGLAISSDMQKGLGAAITQVYPDVEHRECMRHMYSNFKKQFRGDFFKSNIWGAANTYSITHHNRLLEEISKVSKEAIVYLNEHHNKIWSRSKFGTTSKCDYITNNISESFNSWIGDARFRPVVDLLDSIREMLMNLGEYQVSRSSDNRAEAKYKGKRWEVLLDQRICSCRVWQVKGLPCVHAAAFIAFTRDANWDSYVDPYFTIDKFKEAYALEISPIPDKDQ
ncbi:hypothetical protein Tco_0904921 [Tanacetum coccineum]